MKPQTIYLSIYSSAFPFQRSVFRTVGDHCNYNSSGVVLHVGGNYNQSQNSGAFYLNGNNSASNKNANIGCHILVIGYIAAFVFIILLHPLFSRVYIGRELDSAHLLVKIMSKQDGVSTFYINRTWESFIDNKEINLILI